MRSANAGANAVRGASRSHDVDICPLDRRGNKVHNISPVKNLDTEFCRNVKSARREAGLTQSALAAEIGCKQSALSMFEQGDGTKLSDAVIEKLAKKFNLSVGNKDSKEGSVSNFQLSTLNFKLSSRGFCPNPSCPTNKEYFVEEVRLFLPDHEAADPVGGKYCAMCGELLERRCPSCGAAVHAGAICSLCGQPYVVAAK